jgi:hypothetical protein
VWGAKTVPPALTWPSRLSLVFVDEGDEDWPTLDPLAGQGHLWMAGRGGKSLICRRCCLAALAAALAVLCR